MSERWSLLEIDGVEDAIRAAVPPPKAAPAPVVAPVAAAPVVAPEVVRSVAAEARRAPLIAVEQASEATGAVVYWQLSGDVDASRFQAAWAAQGLDAKLLPEVATAEVALTRAVKEMAARDVLIRKHPEGGWAIVYERKVLEGETAKQTLDYDVGARVWLEDEQVKIMGKRGIIPANFGATADAIRAEYAKARASLSTVDVSSWLVWLAGRLDAVPLRDRGGVYFCPKQSVETLHKVKAALGQVSSHTVHEIPAMRSAEAVAAVFDAISREAGDMLSAVENELAGEVGARAARNRIKELDGLLAKVRSYEALLGRELQGVRAKAEELQGKLAKCTTRAAQLEID